MKTPHPLAATAALALLLAAAGCTTLARHRTSAHVARVAFCHAEGLTQPQTAALSRAIIRLNPQVVWYRGPLFDTPDANPNWRAAILKQNIPSATERGPLFIATLDPIPPGADQTPAYTTLMNSLSLADRPWKIVLLEHSLALPQIARPHLALTALLERQQTALAIAADATGYARSIPIGPDNRHAVRHIILGSGRTAPHPTTPNTPDLIAAALPQPHLALIEATEKTLHWNLYDLQGRLRDTLTLSAGATPAHFLSATEIMAAENAPQAELPGSDLP